MKDNAVPSDPLPSSAVPSDPLPSDPVQADDPQSWVDSAMTALADACAGRTPALEFTPGTAGSPPGWTLRHDVADDDDAAGRGAAVVVRTSGSTGTPKQTLLSSAALRASAQMTAERLGGHGQWLLTLQPSYVAGLAVLSRSLEAGTVPQVLLEHTTDPDCFAAAAEQMTHRRRYVSLVPAQLERLLRACESGHGRCARVLRRFDTVLLGGAASDPSLLRRAAAAGITVVRTYGMSETAGGCVYDGRPLPGAHIGLSSDSRVQLSGPMTAIGYWQEPERTAAHFDRDPETGLPRFTTEDFGELAQINDEDQPVLRITGRVDDVINTGGVKVSAEAVRGRLVEHAGVAEAFVGSAPDPVWGERVCAAVVLEASAAQEQGEELGDGPPDGPGASCAAFRGSSPGASHGGAQASTLWQHRLAEHVRTELGGPAAPKLVIVVQELPRLTSGKPDRTAIRALFRQISTTQQKETRGHH